MTKPSRRTSIGKITAPALAVAATCEAAARAAASSDPTFAAIQDYVRRYGEWYRLCALEVEIDEAKRFGRKPPVGDIADIDEAQAAMEAALDQVISTTPTTVAGVAALVRFVLDDPTEMFDVEEDRLAPLFATALDGLNNIVAGGGQGAPGGAS